MKQNDSKYHQLYLLVKDSKDFICEDDKTDILKTIKELYHEHIEYINDSNGKYGIRYTTCHDDSRYQDKHTQFFISKEKRDNVYDDWINDRYWDNIFNEELEYRTPSPNVGDIKKIFKYDGHIYDEK